MNEVRGRKAQKIDSPVPGCLGKMVNLFDLGTAVNGNKLLTDKPHLYGNDYFPLLLVCSLVMLSVYSYCQVPMQVCLLMFLTLTKMFLHQVLCPSILYLSLSEFCIHLCVIDPR